MQARLPSWAVASSWWVRVCFYRHPVSSSDGEVKFGFGALVWAPSSPTSARCRAALIGKNSLCVAKIFLN
jgi:hypothetical protein